MAAKKKSKRKVASRKTRPGVIDQNSLILILGGGLLVIIFVSIFFGVFSVQRTNRMELTAAEYSEVDSKETVITIQNNTFSSPVIVKKGTKVTFMNNDTDDHTVVADDGSFDLGIVTSDYPKSHVFDVTGTFSYHCSLHEGMEGTIIVE